MNRVVLALGVLLFVWPLESHARQRTTFDLIQDGKSVQPPDSIRLFRSLTEFDLRELLLPWYADKGFLNASVDSVGADQVYTSTGCRFELNPLIIEVQDTGAADTLRSQGTYTKKRLQSIRAELIREQADQGYLFTAVTISNWLPDPETCAIQATLSLDRGTRADSSRIYFEGSFSNSTEWLRRAANYKADQLLTPLYLQALRRNLQQTQLFERVEPARLYLNDGKPAVVFALEQRNLNRFEGLLGYVPDASGQGQVVGNAELSLWNVLTEGNGLDFIFQRLRPETSQIDLGISQQWYGAFDLGLNTGFGFYQNDSTYQSREFRLGAEYRIQPDLLLKGGIHLQASTSSQDVPLQNEPDGSRQTARFGFEYSSIESPEVPRQGLHIEMILGVSGKTIEDSNLSDFTQRELMVLLRNIVPLNDQSLLVNSIHGYFLESQEYTFHDLYRFGGAHSLRGFAEDQFRASRVIWGDVEYRFLLDSRSYLLAFAAGAWYERPDLYNEPEGLFSQQDYIYSGGIGLSYRVRIGRLRFSYAWSPDESLSNGKVHIGIQTRL